MFTRHIKISSVLIMLTVAINSLGAELGFRKMNIESIPKRCELEEGFYDKEFIYLSQGQKFLVTHQWANGTVSFLAVYEAATCKKVLTFDTTGGKVAVSGNKIVFYGGSEPLDEKGEVEACIPAVVWELAKDSTFKYLQKESVQLTQKEFGVTFSVRSRIQFPRTKNAKILSTIEEHEL